MRDVDYDRDDGTAYECFGCGTIVTRETNPGRCPDCGGRLRNRMIPLE